MKQATLYRLAAQREYEQIVQHVHLQPEDSYWTDRYGSTALHLICQAQQVDGQLLKAVDAILQHASNLIEWPNVATWTPLHFAVERRLCTHNKYSTLLVLKLIHACPSAVSVRTKAGFKTKTPFHIACEADAHYSVLKAMLQINHKLATEPFLNSDSYRLCDDESPLRLVWKHGTHDTHRKMALLLQAAYCGDVSSSFSVLAAACSVKCPKPYLEALMEQHSNQVFQPDEHGEYPLHRAVASSTPESYRQLVIERLLQVYPKAAQMLDRHGRLPLHVLVERGATWHKGGLRVLVHGYSGALGVPDPENGLVPSLASAAHAARSRLHLSTTFELFVTAPEMVQHLRRASVDAKRIRNVEHRWQVHDDGSSWLARTNSSSSSDSSCGKY